LADTQPLGQILACFLNCLFLAQSHMTTGSFLRIDNRLTTRFYCLFHSA